MIPPELLHQLVTALADELAPKVAASLDGGRAPAREAAEEWCLLDVDEVGRRLKRSTRTVREWAKTGDLPFVRLDGGALGFLLEDVQEFARARRVGGDESV